MTPRCRLSATNGFLTLVLLCFLSATGVSIGSTGTAASHSDFRLGFFFWHLKGSPLNRSDFDPRFPQRFEYLKLEEWSPNGWAPTRIDVVLESDSEGRARLQAASEVRVVLSLKVGPLRRDPGTGLTDFSHLQTEAVWLPAYLVKRIPKAGLTKSAKLVLLRDLDLKRITGELWRRNLWPVELRVDVVLEPLQAEGLREAAISKELPILPGD